MGLFDRLFGNKPKEKGKYDGDIMWAKYYSFNFSISHSNEYSGLILFRIDRLDP